jgi:hypothetical protein
MQLAGKQYFYINGDSWLSLNAQCITNSDNPLFKDIFVINHSVPGSSNMSIINRTKDALAELKIHGINPMVCIGLSEVGRDLQNECALSRPQENLTEYLKSIMLQQMSMLDSILVGYKHYICTAWVTNPRSTKTVVDFIPEDFSDLKPVYTVGNGSYRWLDDRQNVLKFTKESFVDAVECKQIFEKRLLASKYIDNLLHLDMHHSNEINQKFFSHVLSTIRGSDDNY